MRKTRWYASDRGSLPFAMLVVVVTIVTTAMLATTLTWQARAASREQARQDARWAADSATSIALENLSTLTTALTGAPVVTSLPTSATQGPPWRPVTTGNQTTMRWYIVRSATVDDITLIAEGRATNDYPVTHTSVISLRYDQGAKTWVAYQVSSNISVPSA